MADEITELEPSDVTFLEKLKVSGNSAVFKVAVHGKACVMKVVSELCWLLILLLSTSSIMIEVHLIVILQTAK